MKWSRKSDADAHPPLPPAVEANSPASTEVAPLEAAELNPSAVGSDPSSWTVWVERFTTTVMFVARNLRWLILAAAVAVALIGVSGLIIGLVAWYDFQRWHVPLGVLVVLILCLPAVGLPFWVHRRTLPLARIVANPSELVTQSRSYAGSLRSNANLSDVAALTKKQGRFKPTNVWHLTRTLATITDRVKPDPKTQPLLAALNPIYLKTLWVLVLATGWALAAAVIVLLVSGIALLFGWTP